MIASEDLYPCFSPGNTFNRVRIPRFLILSWQVILSLQGTTGSSSPCRTNKQNNQFQNDFGRRTHKLSAFVSCPDCAEQTFHGTPIVLQDTEQPIVRCSRLRTCVSPSKIRLYFRFHCFRSKFLC